MLGHAFLLCLLAANAWMTRRVWRAPSEYLRHKKILIASIWLMPVLGVVMGRAHLRHYVPGEAYRRTSRRPIAQTSNALAPHRLEVAGAPPLDVMGLMHRTQGFPLLDRAAAKHWLSLVDDSAVRAQAADALGHAWLLHLRDASGSRFGVHESTGAWLLSALDRSIVEADAALVLAARGRVLRWLGALAGPAAARALVVVFHDAESYSQYLTANGVAEHVLEKTADTGVFIDGACPHFACASIDLRPLEPLMVREFTREGLAHLPIPVWLSHGIAEHARCQLADARPHEWVSWALLESFWDDSEIQGFWSGEIFERDAESAELACELARLLVERLAGSQGVLQQFTTCALRDDAGAQAARDILGVDLGAYVCALLGLEPQVSWSPRTVTVV